MLEQLTGRQLDEWLAFYIVESETRSSDDLPPEKKEQTVDEMVQAVKSIAAMQGIRKEPFVKRS